jgi:hypothetical protein
MVAVMALGLAACGSSTEPGGPLRVESVTPAALASDVQVTDQVTIVFSKALRPGSANDTTIVLSHSGFRVIGTTTLSADGRTVTIAPRLGNSQFYVLEIRTGVLDAAGNPLAEPYVTAFSTVAAGPVNATDPSGDTYNGLTDPDVVSITATPGKDTLTIRLGFSHSVSATSGGLPNATGGLIDLDIDQDPLTGLEALTDAFGPVGTSTGLGIEYYVSLFDDGQGNGVVIDIATGAVKGLVPLVFGTNSITAKVPVAAIGGGGNANIAAVVGNATLPTDVVPNLGHLIVGTAGEVGGSRAPAALRAGRARRPGPLGIWGR